MRLRSSSLSSSLSFLSLALVAVAGCTVESVAEPGIRQGSATSSGQGTGNSTAGEPTAGTGAKTTKTPDPGTSLASETWADGKTIASNVTVAADAIIEIAPGAVITLGTGVAITVKGTLKVSSASKHAKLTGGASKWEGIVVAQGGTLLVDGLDLDGATTALSTKNGNAGATFQDGVIKADTPFSMEAGSTLSVLHSSVSATAGSDIAGTFTASYMTYDKSTASGLTLADAQGSMTFSDSTLKGAGGGDYVIVTAGKLVKLEYTVVSGAHCALHFDTVDQFTLDHVSLDLNSYGGMLYGSGAGPNTITSSNVQGTEFDLDMQGKNGALTIAKSYLAPGGQLSGTPTPVDAATARLADAKPR